jgi:hypothetical protein
MSSPGGRIFAGLHGGGSVPNERRAHGLIEARRRDGVGRSHCPYKRVDPEVIARGRQQASKGGN